MRYHNRFETREAMAKWLESEYVSDCVAYIDHFIHLFYVAVDNDKYYRAFTEIEEMFELFEKLKRLLPKELNDEGNS